MNIGIVEEIKYVSAELINAQRKLEQHNSSYDYWNNQSGYSKVRSTKHEALCNEIIRHEIEPLSKELESLAEQLTN